MKLDLSQAWIVAATVVLIVTLAAAVLRRLFVSRFKPSDRTDFAWGPLLYELARRTLLPAVFIAAVYAVSPLFPLSAETQRILSTTFAVAAFLQGALWAD